MLTASGPGGPNHWGDSATNNSTAGTQSADAQLKVSLCIIYLYILGITVGALMAYHIWHRILYLLYNVYTSQIFQLYKLNLYMNMMDSFMMP